MKRIFRVTVREGDSEWFTKIDHITITGKDILEICQIAAKNEKVWLKQACLKSGYKKPIIVNMELEKVAD